MCHRNFLQYREEIPQFWTNKLSAVQPSFLQPVRPPFAVLYGLVWLLLLLYKSGEYIPNLLFWKTSDAASVLSPINSELCCPVAADNSDEAVLSVLHNMASECPPVAALAQLQNTPSSTAPSFSSLCPAPSPLLLIQND
jgi:hypothetical protein